MDLTVGDHFASAVTDRSTLGEFAERVRKAGAQELEVCCPAAGS